MSQDNNTDVQTDFNIDESKPCFAACCVFSGFYWPESGAKGCFGATLKGDFLCLGIDTKCCRPVDTSKNDEGHCCVCWKGEVVMKKCQDDEGKFLCAAIKQQCCCFGGGCALPCSDEYAPCMCTLLPCCVVYGGGGAGLNCCKSVKDINNKEEFTDPSTAGAPDVIEMVA